MEPSLWKNTSVCITPSITASILLVLNCAKQQTEVLMPSNKLRFLNKACIIVTPQQDLNSDKIVSDPWSLCIVGQVEELKALIKVIPIWSTGKMIFVTLSLSSFLFAIVVNSFLVKI
ncbi:hypothetical protein CFOL_v3_00423 [Cephalotus follicularis]|uniref:Uncharacterized protein n=1 Tax=Cephalotus follicularis TaxID=3775 RepID=A0A1Q3AMU6_CEPFO|nr:hypothetical protein CFOL_v3_00423 [Cephalotus follicularis]